jgi:HlyD family secretion protein
MKRRLILFIMALAMAGGGVAWAMGLFQQPESSQTLKLFGNVDIRQVNLSFRVSGRVAQMVFEEGDMVKAGDVVALLDTVPLEDEARVAKANVEQATATLAKFKTGNRPQEIAVTKAVVAAREAALIHAEKEYQRDLRLLEKNAVAQCDFEAAESTKVQAAANLASAKESLSLMMAGFREEEINAAQASLHASEASLTQVRTRLSDARLLAPSDGVLLTRVVEPGAMVDAGQTVATLSLTKTVWVRAYVNEKDLGRIHPGMSG